LIQYRRIKIDALTARVLSNVINNGPVGVITKNGYHIVGTVTEVGGSSMIVDVQGETHLILMDAVSTITGC
jgi:sRNA-binding regulator protein Hfq